MGSSTLLIQRVVVAVLSLLVVTSVGAEKAPQLVLERMDGSTFSLEKTLESGPVVFDFWATLVQTLY